MAVAEIHPHQSKIYYEFSHLYDRVFTRFFFPRIQSTIRSLKISPRAKVLEVGVGTGLSLSAYPPHAEVIGIDLAQEMLDQAQEKISRNGWRHVFLRQMDALNLEFSDESFDYVMGFHVVSVVPDHLRLMREMHRVCKPGGTLVIINHFRSQRRWLAPFIDRLDPITRKLGWRTTLKLSDLLDGVPLRVQRKFKTSERSLFTVLIASKPLPDGMIIGGDSSSARRG